MKNTSLLLLLREDGIWTEKPFGALARNLPLVLPPILCFFGARWLMDRFGLGSWVLLIAVLLALASIVSAFTQFFRYMLRQAEEEERDYKESGL